MKKTFHDSIPEEKMIFIKLKGTWYKTGAENLNQIPIFGASEYYDLEVLYIVDGKVSADSDAIELDFWMIQDRDALPLFSDRNTIDETQ